jgi:hypothetical protein
MPQTGHRGRGRRLGTYLTSVVLLAAQLLYFGHLVFVRHVACPRHGDVIHSRHAAGKPQRLAPKPPCPQPTTGTAPNAEWSHDHCLSCTSALEPYALFPPADRGVVGHRLAIPLLPGSDADTFVVVAPLDFAPKSSPPTG